MKSVKRVCGTLVGVLSWTVILLAALFCFTTFATKESGRLSNFLGYTPLNVLTDSMKPEFAKGDMIIVKTCDADNLEEGDIISFYSIIENEYALNTHRILEIHDENDIRTYVTKGDANEVEDSHMIADGDIVGEYVTAIPSMGKVMEFMSSSVGFLVIIVLPMLLFLIYQIYNLVNVSIQYKKANAIEHAKEKDEELNKMQAEAKAALAEAERLKAEAEAALKAAQKEVE